MREAEFDPPTHYLGTPEGRSPSGGVKRIACGTAVNLRGAPRYTIEPGRASCFKCATQANGITDEQRQDIWDNANERINAFREAPWVKAKRKAEKLAARAARAAARGTVRAALDGRGRP
jgi:hypothetical protein